MTDATDPHVAEAAGLIAQPKTQAIEAIATALRTRDERIAALEGERRAILDIMSGLSSYLGAGLGDDNTTAAQFDDRIRWGIDHIGSVYRNRAAQVVEECSKRPRTTWGEVKRAILDDTALPTALPTAALKTTQP